MRENEELREEVKILHCSLGYDRVSDVVENGVSFASKILTHNRMH